MSNTHFHEDDLFFTSLCDAGTTNNLLTGELVNVSSHADVQLQCTFLSRFIGSARCRVQYGTDPTYINLPYSAESIWYSRGLCQCGTEGATELHNCVYTTILCLQLVEILL